MKLHWTSALCLGVLAAATSIGVGQDAVAPAQSAWDEAALLEQQGDYAAAAERYAAVPATSPDAQRAALQAGSCLEKVGKLAEAVAAYDSAVAKNSSAYWAELALFQKARTCKAMGNVTEARRCIDRIKARFPDSSSLADALLLEAQLDARNTAAAEALVAKEQEATGLYKQAMLADRNKDTSAALRILDSVVTAYAGTPAALRSRDARAHIFTRHKGSPDRTLAATEFLGILALVADTAPNSRIAETARIRIAALHHSFQNRQDAIATYQGLLNSEDKAIASRAALQLVGLQFELLQRETRSGGQVLRTRWDDLRALCTLAAQSKEAKPIERARAEVMAIESLSWEDRDPDAVAAAEDFLAKYQGDEFKLDIATVRSFAGEAAQRIGLYDQALAHYRWIVEAYPGQVEIWPHMDHLPRVYFRIWEVLRRSRAPAEAISQAAEAVLTTFAESDYAKHIRIVTRQDARWAEMKGKAQP